MRIALPKGRLLQATDAWLRESGVEFDDYSEESRSYRPKCNRFPDLEAKVFNERDIPVQVAVGNYDLGVCGLHWVEELMAKYPSSALVKLHDLGYGECAVYAAVSRESGLSSADDIQASSETIRIAAECPNLAESLALHLRLKRFKILPLWGSAEEYRQESELVAELIQEFTQIEVQSILDIGCGGGKNAFHLKQYFKLTGIDISEAMLDNAKKLNPE